MNDTPQRILITGATGGLGLGLAEYFVRRGCRVAIHGRNPQRVESAVAAVSRRLHSGATDCAATEKVGRAFGVVAELTEAPEHAVTRACESLGGLDGVIHVAGIQPVKALLSLSVADMREMLETNVVAAQRITLAAHRAQAAWVTHIASIEAIRPAPGHAHYAAAKAALVMHAKAAALETAPMRVNAVSPGLLTRDSIETEWPEGVASWNAHAPLGRLVTPEDIAHACDYLANARAVTGHNLVVDAGMTQTPGW